LKKPIIAAVDDMFFAAKIRATAEHLCAEVSFSRNTDALIIAARETKPALVIVDLHAQKFDPFRLARILKSDEDLRAIKLLGFFSHVQTALMQQAKEAGFDFVMPRSAFTNRLAEILEQGMNGDAESETRNDE
jgi:PleD family two-component response regulator